MGGGSKNFTIQQGYICALACGELSHAERENARLEQPASQSAPLVGCAENEGTDPAQNRGKIFSPASNQERASGDQLGNRMTRRTTMDTIVTSSEVLVPLYVRCGTCLPTYRDAIYACRASVTNATAKKRELSYHGVGSSTSQLVVDFELRGADALAHLLSHRFFPVKILHDRPSGPGMFWLGVTSVS